MKFTKSPNVPPDDLHEFHPMTIVRDWGDGDCFRLADALSGVCIFGATGSGKSSGPGRHLAYGYLANGFGGLVLAAKPGEVDDWREWAAETGRSDDLIVVDATGQHRFNFLDWESRRPGEGGGLTINLVALLDEIAGAIAGSAGGAADSGGNKFFEDALHHMNTNIVDLPIFAGIPVSLPLMRSIVTTAPQSPQEVESQEWRDRSVCAAIIREADLATKDAPEDIRKDFEECRNYWFMEYPALSEKTRSIITLSFSMLVRPFITRPLRRLFSSETNITPEAAFDGRIVVINLPIQEFRLAGRIAQLAWKYCFQVAVLRRTKPTTGYLRPVFLWADEAQNFVSDFDAEYQSVARSAAGCTVFLTQNRESYRRVLGNNDAVDSLLGNLQTKIFCQNSGETNEWAAKLLGERWLDVISSNVGRSAEGNPTSGVTRSEQRRYFVEPAAFTTLKRGGEINHFEVEAIVYKGGHQFLSNADGKQELLPYKLLTFKQV
ncbi:MAG TPA: TraM recognition domain-containing protein [Fimbriimonadaceae bacterium]|nr:TraM recognition domain-containing protein [Fimbriimonadaceae bacterium]